MLSICIPVYNYDVGQLARSIYRQCNNANIDFEILVYEDGSIPEFVKINSDSLSSINSRHLISTQNMGRSFARNHLAKNACFSKLLFLDCDSLIDDNEYIKNYLKNIEHQVVCGGTKYLNNQKKSGSELRLKYGFKREMTSAEKRNQNPNKSFTTNNFLVDKKIFEEIRFREELTKYGHEDSLFGFELKAANIKIKHIDNPVIHNGLETNKIFVEKTKHGIENLVFIETNISVDERFFNEITLISAYYKIKKTRLIFFVKTFNRLFGKAIEKHLIKSNNPCIYFFDLFKIGYYCKIKTN